MAKAKKHNASRQTSRFLFVSAFTVSTLLFSQFSNAGATFKIDDTKWVSIGAGLRTSFSATENGAPNGQDWSNDFNLDNMRLYLNAQLHEYIKLEFNTECTFCGSSGGTVSVLDAIGKFEIDPMYNLWVGRMLVPAERREMNGPFYSSLYNTFRAGTPFEPSDYGTSVSTGNAGVYGRDDGATVWGSFVEGRLQYAVGFFRGLRGGANQKDNILYAQRVAYNFWEVEKNPGYYTSGTYYGKGGDILTLAVSNQFQADGAGTEADPGDFRGTTVDLLMEKVLSDNAVVTVNGEFKNYGITGGYSQATRDSADPGFNMFEGNAFDVSAMYLLPQQIWIGQLQPYLRYVGVYPDGSSARDAYEAGVNYVIDGHNAMVTLGWTGGDLLSKGLDYSSSASGGFINSVTLGLQLQI